MNKTQAALVLGLAETLRDRGSWCGATHIQKAAYCLSALGGDSAGLEADFIIYKHGPYSFDLQDQLTELQALGLLKLEPSPVPYGPRFVVTERGRGIMEQVPHAIQRATPAIDFVATWLATKGVAQLERLGTALYVTKENPGMPLADRAREITRLKPHVSLEQAEAALSEVDATLEKARALA